MRGRHKEGCVESVDYEQRATLMNCFLVIILSYELLHEAQWHIIKDRPVVGEVQSCRVSTYGIKHRVITP